MNNMFSKIDIRNTKESKIIKSLIVVLVLDILFFTLLGRFFSERSLIIYTSIRLICIGLHFIIIAICILVYLIKIALLNLNAIEELYEIDDLEYSSVRKSFGSIMLLIFEIWILSEIILHVFRNFSNNINYISASKMLICLLLIEMLVSVLRLYVKNRVSNLKFNIDVEEKA